MMIAFSSDYVEEDFFDYKDKPYPQFKLQQKPTKPRFDYLFSNYFVTEVLDARYYIGGKY